MDSRKDVEEILDKVYELTYPNFLKSSPEQHSFRNYVLEKHMVIERTMNVIIVAYFFDEFGSGKAELFNDFVVDKIDFTKKLGILLDLKILEKNSDKSIINAIYKTNDYRVAQSHVKKDNNHLRDPEEKEKFQDCSTKATSGLYTKLMPLEKNIRKAILDYMEKHKSK